MTVMMISDHIGEKVVLLYYYSSPDEIGRSSEEQRVRLMSSTLSF